MKTIITDCDYRCGQSANVDTPPGWFMLTQPSREDQGNGPKLKRELQFCSLACMRSWVMAAEDALPNLQEHARGLIPRGEIGSPDVVGLFI